MLSIESYSQGKLRDYLDLTSAKAFYRSLILPTFTYSGILQLKTTDTQYKRLASFHDRSLRTIQGNSSTCDEIQSVTNANKIRACKLVRKCIDKDICDTFQGYSMKSMITKCVQETTNVW